MVLSITFAVILHYRVAHQNDVVHHISVVHHKGVVLYHSVDNNLAVVYHYGP